MQKIAIVAGEASGDLLGAHLIAALSAKRSDLNFFGIAGPKMMHQGAKSLYALEKLSVRGYLEVLTHLPSLLKLRKRLLQQILQEKPAVFIGIDAPDFNFWLERQLKKHGIPTIHYVSPSIWAWRGKRIHGIKKAVSHVLALFPFEPPLYEAVAIPITFVGHPLAEALPVEPDRAAARELLKLQSDEFVVAMLPGSRQSEVLQHAALFVQTANRLSQDHKRAKFLVPLITRKTRELFEAAIEKHADPALPLQLLFGHAHDAMEAANVVIVASGTATLEAALLKRPMVITYRMPYLSWQLLKRMQYLPYVGLPNILAGKFLVPELLQEDATPEKLADAVNLLLADSQYLADLQQAFVDMHMSLKHNAADKAADIVLSYL